MIRTGTEKDEVVVCIGSARISWRIARLLAAALVSVVILVSIDYVFNPRDSQIQVVGFPVKFRKW